MLNLGVTMVCNCTKYSAPLRTMQDVEERCNRRDQIERHLIHITSESSGWTSVLKCRKCGAFWAKEYPFSEYHGGGQACLYRIYTADPNQWLDKESGLTDRLRQVQEDRDFFESLGDEVGPETCKHESCRSKRVKNSVMCRHHHFFMIQGREYSHENGK